MPQGHPAGIPLDAPAPDRQDAGRPGWLSRCWLACLVGISTACVAWLLRFDFLLQDGESLLSLHTSPWQSRPHWYHVLHLETARALGLLGLSPYNSLRATSALFAGASLAALTALFGSLQAGSRKPLYAALAMLLCTPALWFHGRLIEVHTAQLFGATVISWGALQAGQRGLLFRALFVFATLSLGALLHRANILLATALAVAPLIRAWFSPGTSAPAERPGPVNGSAPPGAAGFLARLATSMRNPQVLATLAGILLALPLLQWAWGLSSMGPEKGAWEMNLWLLVSFWRGISARFLVDDLLFGMPCVLLVLFCAVRLLGAPLKQLSEFELFSVLGFLFLLCFYTLFGETTHGGYILGLAPAAAGTLAASFRATPWIWGSRWMQTAFVVCCVSGAVASVSLSKPENGPDLEQVMRAKREGLRAFRGELGVPICVLSCDPSLQVVNGQIEGLHEIDLSSILFGTIRAGVDPQTVIDSKAGAVIARLRPHGLPVLLTAWADPQEEHPLHAEANRLLIEFFVTELGAEPRSQGALRLWVPPFGPDGR